MSAPDIRTIVDVAARFFGVEPGDVLSPRRRAAEVRARQAAMWLAFELTGASLEEIGSQIGNRDRTTVRHGINQVEARRERDPDFAAELAEIAKAIRIVSAADATEVDPRLFGGADAVAIAYRVLVDPRAPVRPEDLRILARAVLGATHAAENPLVSDLIAGTARFLCTLEAAGESGAARDLKGALDRAVKGLAL